MFEVKLNKEKFYFLTFSEINDFFSEVIMAEGADSAKITIKMVELKPELL
jgi:hypothetical protein